MMKILFFGTPRFAEIVLQGLIESRHEIVGVVCQNDKPAGRGNKIKSPHIVEIAKENGIAVYQFEKLSQHIEDFKKIECDVAVTASYGKIIPKSLLDVMSFVNVHPSMLPKYRGATPIQTALLNGDKKTGVTIMKTEVGMDDGDIYMQQEADILPEEDYTSLQNRLADLGLELLLQVLDKIEQGTATRTPQNSADATYVKLIEKDDAYLDFSCDVHSLVNKVRAYCENPVAFFFIGGVRIKVFKARVADMTTSAVVGKFISIKKRFLIQAKDGVFEVLKCQASGGKILDATAFLNGFRFNFDVADKYIRD